MLSPKQRKTLHNTRKTVFCEGMEDAVAIKNNYPNHHATIHTCNGGANDGRVFLHLIEKDKS